MIALYVIPSSSAHFNTFDHFKLLLSKLISTFQERLERMEMDVQSLKEEVNAKSEELDIRLRCLHEFQMSTNQKHFAHAGENKAELRLVLAFNQT
jgi:hypothetical protein